jgi:hypothetical protein
MMKFILVNAENVTEEFDLTHAEANDLLQHELIIICKKDTERLDALELRGVAAFHPNIVDDAMAFPTMVAMIIQKRGPCIPEPLPLRNGTHHLMGISWPPPNSGSN